MKANREIRNEAWGIVRGKWFWRIVTAGGVLYLISLIVSGFLAGAFKSGSIQTWPDFLEAKLRAAQQGLGYTVPSSAAFWQMTGASAFQQFIGCIFGGIVLFGLAVLFLKAARNDDKGWFASAFGGFTRPLGVFWLLLLMNVWIFLWSLLLVIPGLIAVYRYRQAWYIKSENPEWGAAKCIGESCKMMKGYKWRAFCLDASFAWWFLLAALVCGLMMSAGIGLGAAGNPLLSILGTFLGVVGFYFIAFVICYFAAGRAVFYRDLALEASPVR